VSPKWVTALSHERQGRLAAAVVEINTAEPRTVATCRAVNNCASVRRNAIVPIAAPSRIKGTQRIARKPQLRRRRDNYPGAQIARPTIPPARSHRKRRIDSMIVTAHAAPKIATNNRSPCDNARPQPPPAIRESPISSRKPGSIRGAFMSHLFQSAPTRRVDGPEAPDCCEATHRRVGTCHDAHG
jgi:hypothetical protein